jgi:tellurite resistance protein TehA-like permease
MAGSWTPSRTACSSPALFFTILVLSLLPVFLGLPFAVSWWAYTFPLDAMDEQGGPQQRRQWGMEAWCSSATPAGTPTTMPTIRMNRR